MAEEIVKKFELDLLNSETRKSPKKLNELLAEDFFEFTQSGKIHTKQDIIKLLPQCSEEKFSVRDYQEKELSSTIILVHYIVDREIIENSEKRRTLCSSIWRQKNSKWQMMFFQGTPTKFE